MPRLTALVTLALLAGCGARSVPAAPATDQDHSAAKALIAQNCLGCHQVPGVRGPIGWVGPSLAGIARQQIIAGKFVNNPDTMARWLMHPQAMVPGNAMPEMGLSAAQAKTISDYLYTLDKR